MPSIDLLISTMNYRPGALERLLATVPDSVNVIVANQISNVLPAEKPFRIKANVTCYSFKERGLSKSRNRLIALATSDIFVISDDDIEFVPNAFDHIGRAFQNNAQQDILTFVMVKPGGEPRKRYAPQSFQHDRFSIAKVSSCEIAVRRKSFYTAQISYDESFGLGARFPMGEEVVLLHDCIRAGLKIRFIPIAISCHPEESTGREFSAASETARGAVFYRVYGLLSYFLGIGFYFRKRRAVAGSVGYSATLRAYLRGIDDYKSFRKKNLSDQLALRHAD